MKKLLMALMLMPLMALADTEVVDGIPWTYTVSNGKAEIGNGYSSAIPSTTTGAITIPTALGGYPVTSIGDWSFVACAGLKSVTIPEGVTNIGNDAFMECVRIELVSVPSSVVHIGSFVF